MDSGFYFLTFRLADSLPEAVLQQMRRRLSSKLEDDEGKRQLARAIERYLDKGSGACYLKQARIASLVAAAIQHQDGKTYRLMAWVVMPNHVHLVFRLLPGQKLAGVVQALKSYTGHEANRLLRRSGTFWQREYFDHLIRNDHEFDRAIRYVLSNPEKAGLVHWKWVGCCGPEARSTAGEDAGATEEP
ncbi:MAG: REP-associated tyrosine transposase [Terriglobales bacterium]